MLKRSLSSTALAASLALASNLRSEFEDYAVPDAAADTIYTTTESIVHYGDNPAMTEAYIQMLVGTGYVQDTTEKTLTTRLDGFRHLVRNTDGVVVEAHHFVTMQGFQMPQDDWVATLDGQGRQKMETWDNGGDVDSTYFTWTHPNCPDRETVDADGTREKLVWNVDGSGNCSKGVRSRLPKDATGWTDSVAILSWEWESGKPAKEAVYTSSGTTNDTSEITRITYSGGVPVTKKRWSKEGFLPMMLAESCSVSSDGGVFTGQTCVQFLDDNTGRISERTILSIHPIPTPIQPRRFARGSDLRAWPSSRGFRFLNPGQSARTIELRSLDGAKLGRYRIEAGQQLTAHVRADKAVWKTVDALRPAAGMLIAPH